MEKARQNVRVVAEEDLLLAAQVDEPNRRRLARARLRQSFEAGLVKGGGFTSVPANQISASASSTVSGIRAACVMNA